jgi:hypothetical protein
LVHFLITVKPEGRKKGKKKREERREGGPSS